jgi:hypothetical protein
VILDRQHGLRLDGFRHCGVKVGLSFEILRVTVIVELVLQHIFRPTETGSRTQVKLSFQFILATRHNQQIFSPTNFCNQWLQFWLICVIFCVITPIHP